MISGRPNSTFINDCKLYLMMLHYLLGFRLPLRIVVLVEIGRSIIRNITRFLEKFSGPVSPFFGVCALLVGEMFLVLQRDRVLDDVEADIHKLIAMLDEMSIRWGSKVYREKNLFSYFHERLKGLLHTEIIPSLLILTPLNCQDLGILPSEEKDNLLDDDHDLLVEDAPEVLDLSVATTSREGGDASIELESLLDESLEYEVRRGLDF